MNIPDEYFKLILQEFKDAEKLCKEAESPDDALYFFSAFFGTINRVMNFHCDPVLVFMHQVLQSAHKAVLSRLEAKSSPGVTNNGVAEDTWNALFNNIPKLIKAFQSKDEKKIWPVLQTYANIEYANCGNGRYLQLKGRLKL